MDSPPEPTATSPFATATATATTSTPPTTSSSFSHFIKTVSLSEWWLVNPDDDASQGSKRLAVSGFTSFTPTRQKQAMRVFRSAPIKKRHDLSVLETSEGITILLRGFINEARTLENGFSHKIFKHFLFGFPPQWEEYANEYFTDADDSAYNWEHTSSLNGATSDPVVLGTKDSSPIMPEVIEEESRAAKECTAEQNIAVKADKPGLSASKCFNIDDPKTLNIDCSVSVGLPSIVLALTSKEMGGENCKAKPSKEPLRNLTGNLKAISRCSVQVKNRRPVSDASKNVKRKKNSRTTSPNSSELNMSERLLRAACNIRSSQPTSKGPRSSKKNTRRKIFFDFEDSPRAQETKEKKRVLSPETFSCKRSRSGRLLVKPLEFWRNQIPIYDAGRNISGIQEELDPVNLFRGSKSEPPNRKRK